METIMDEFETTESDGFVLLPAANGGGALVRRSQIAGARANGRDGAIVYAKCGPSIYTTATVPQRSEEHTSELQSLMRISYAVFCLKQKNKYTHTKNETLKTT